MKKLLFLFVLVISIYGCGSDDIIPNPTPPEPEPAPSPEPTEHVVSFGFSGEITSITEGPLGRNASDNLYGIQVHSVAPNDYPKPYAYGLFDSNSGISIKLLDGYKYNIVCTMVVDGKKRIYNDYYGYGSPFSAQSSTPLDNSFVYTTDGSMYNIGSGGTALYDNQQYNYVNRPNTDRYYGQVMDYSPQESGVININMVRASFGIKVVAEGLTEGKIKMTFENIPTFYLEYPQTEFEDIFTFYDVFSCAYNENHSESIPFSASWFKDDGSTIPLVSENITFPRNKLITIVIKVDDLTINGDMNITHEDTEMGDGGVITFGERNSTETGINPETGNP